MFMFASIVRSQMDELKIWRLEKEVRVLKKQLEELELKVEKLSQPKPVYSLMISHDQELIGDCIATCLRWVREGKSGVRWNGGCNCESPELSMNSDTIRRAEKEY